MYDLYDDYIDKHPREDWKVAGLLGRGRVKSVWIGLVG